ncbi:MAG TPA: peptidylprolyl isomerase [Ferruginibacter sp.]|jgi:peptidyl-prolyl cis-trans isomerase SurA|nr:peptidylprolyl isomerase [Ferruginibacter sp.]
MTKNFLFLITCFLFGTAAFAQQKIVADKIVAVIGDKVILKSDIDNTISDMVRQGQQIPDNAKCLTLEQAMGIKALVLQAEKDSLPVTDEEVDADIDNQIRYFISAYGSKEELERISGKTMYQLKEDFKEGFRERKLASAMRNKIVEDVRITPNEVKAYFDRIPVDSLPYFESEVEIGQIVVFPVASRDAEDYAVEILNDCKAQLESGRKDFRTLAAIYSDDPGSKDNAGEYEINRNEKQWDPVFLAKAFSLKEGQISTPFKTRFGYHILQLVSRTGDDAVVRHILKVPQITQTEISAGTQKLDSIRTELLAGRLQFGEAVSKYSDDESSKFTGGRKQNAEGSTFLTIDQLDKDMVILMRGLSVGDYSDPTPFVDERGKKGIRIVYLMSRTEPHRENLKDDYNKIAQQALEEKKGVALDDWFAKNVGTNYIYLDTEYKSCPEMKKWVNANNSNIAGSN